MVSTRNSSRAGTQIGPGTVGMSDSQTQARTRVTGNVTLGERTPPARDASDDSDPEDLGEGMADHPSTQIGDRHYSYLSHSSETPLLPSGPETERVATGAASAAIRHADCTAGDPDNSPGSSSSDLSSSSGSDSEPGRSRQARRRHRNKTSAKEKFYQKLTALIQQSLVKQTPESEVKAGEMPIFKEKDPTKLETFLLDLEDRFIGAPNRYKTEKKRILLGTSHVSEDARRRWRSKVKRMTGEPTWEDFKIFMRFWVDPEADRGHRAAFRLLNERQEGRSITEWTSQFMEVLPYLTEPLFHAQLLIETLDKEYRRHLTRMRHPPQTVEEVEAEAIRLESIMKRETKANRKADNKRPGDKLEGNNPQPQTKRRRIDGSEEPPVSAKNKNKGQSNHKPRRGKKKDNPVSKEEQDRRREERLCFKCGKSGHQARYCRSKETPEKKTEAKE